jgi:hypothetical protein
LARHEFNTQIQGRVLLRTYRTNGPSIAVNIPHPPTERGAFYQGKQMNAPVTRRSFVAMAAGVVTTLGAGALPNTLPATSLSAGTIYGRAGRRGIASGTLSAPSQGKIVLLDGATVEATHVSQKILPGKSVLLSPDGQGKWSVLYAEF